METIEIQELIISDVTRNIEVMETSDIRESFDLHQAVKHVSTSCNCTTYEVKDDKLTLLAKTDLVDQVVPVKLQRNSYIKIITATVVFEDDSTQVYTINATVKKYKDE